MSSFNYCMPLAVCSLFIHFLTTTSRPKGQPPHHSSSDTHTQAHTHFYLYLLLLGIGLARSVPLITHKTLHSPATLHIVILRTWRLLIKKLQRPAALILIRSRPRRHRPSASYYSKVNVLLDIPRAKPRVREAFVFYE